MSISVLIIEDDPDVRNLTSMLLMRDGFTVDCADRLDVGIDKINNGDVDAVLLDLDLPDCSGMETVLRVRLEHPSVPVVILSGSESDDIGLQAVECGAQDYLTKRLVVGELLTRTIRYAIARQRQIAHYKSQANTDNLTGLGNRRWFDEQLRMRLAEYDRHARPVGLMLLDLDHFKSVNDNYGHRAGDFVLSRMGDLLKSHLRLTDLPARFGGEEFSVVLPDSDMESVQVVARRIVTGVADTAFDFEDKHLRMTVSIGVALCQPDDNEHTIVERADNALYCAKSRGRNQVVTQHQLDVTAREAEG